MEVGFGDGHMRVIVCEVLLAVELRGGTPYLACGFGFAVVFFIRFDNALHQVVAHDVLFPNSMRLYTMHAFEDFQSLHQAEAVALGRSI